MIIPERGANRPLLRGGSAVLLVCAFVGWLNPMDDDDKADDLRKIECAPLEWRTGVDTEGWEMLIEQGYLTGRTANGTALYPPECESEMPK
jgi:hypothetical protein